MTAPLKRADIAALTPQLHKLADPASSGEMLDLLRTLYAVGRRDLPLGRLFEGHVDALQIINRYGTAVQVEAVLQAVANGSAFGVWNADDQADPATLAEGRLTGGKAFASGAGLLSHALLTVDRDGARQLLLIDLADAPPEIDRSWWKVVGMQRSETHLVCWNGQPIKDTAFIGRPGDYVREPWFSGGALRFAAVQAGGIAALLDGVVVHLQKTGRANDLHQRARLADLYGHAQAAVDAVTKAATSWSVEDPERTTAYVSAARVGVYRAGEAALALAQASIGLQAMFLDHPIAATLSDLATYLRQPGPDAQRMVVGAAVAEHVLTVAL